MRMKVELKVQVEARYVDEERCMQLIERGCGG